ncbi:MAG: glycosyltransferase family 39 protein [Edaphobacter sp.]
MRFSEKFRLPALLCALALLTCAFAAWPFAETGIVDDWSYIRTAQILAQTGHIVYNGWATAMLGWLLPSAALLIKVFGFSFTVARMSILLVSVATAFLLQRSFVRASLKDWNATLATLTFVLSPLFLPLSVIFMTDVPGILAIVLCFYGCLRALQAATTRTSAAWIIFAALTNAMGGDSSPNLMAGRACDGALRVVVVAEAEAGFDGRDCLRYGGLGNCFRLLALVFSPAKYRPRTGSDSLCQPIDVLEIIHPALAHSDSHFVPSSSSAAYVSSCASKS